MPSKKVQKSVFATHVTAPDGNRIYLRAKSQTELDQKVAAVRTEIAAGVDVSQNYTFEDYAKLWLKTYKLGKVRPTTYDSIDSTMNNHVIPFFGPMPLRDVKPMDVQRFLTSISSYSNSLQNKCLQYSRAVFQCAVDNDIIGKTPYKNTDRIVSKPKEEEEPLSDDQVRALLSAVSGTRAYTFCLIALTTGMRRGEILGLMWSDVDFDKKQINVTHNKAFPANKQDTEVTSLPKTDAGRRVLPLAEVLERHLIELHAASKSQYVLAMQNGNSLNKASFRSLWALIEARTISEGDKNREIGKTYGKKTVTLNFTCHPHQLRHTYITQLFEAGLDLKQVQYLAGHSDPQMTLRVYTHYRRRQREDETKQKVCDALKYIS